MHGQRVLERMQGQNWETLDVRAADKLTPGIYNIFNAKDADKGSRTTGTVLHVDNDSVYQVVQKNVYARHSAGAFDSVPSVGDHVTISYEGAQAIVTKAVQSQQKGIRR